MKASTLHEIRVSLIRIEGSLATISAVQTGRDTHPLWVDKATPMDLHVASTCANMEATVRGLLDTLQMYDEWAHDNSTPPELPTFKLADRDCEGGDGHISPIHDGHVKRHYFVASNGETTQMANWCRVCAEVAKREYYAVWSETTPL